MALSKDKKRELVAEVSELLNTSKMTVVAKYQGTNVKAMQELRRQAKESDTKVKVIKNRLVKKALQQSEDLKDIDPNVFEGMLLYAFNANDEVAPAQSLNRFAKTNPSFEFVGAITAQGKFIDAAEVKALAILPGKDDLIAQVLATLISPINGVMSGLSGNLHTLLDGVAAKAS